MIAEIGDDRSYRAAQSADDVSWHEIRRLEKVNLTESQRRDAIYYNLGHVVEFHRRARRTASAEIIKRKELSEPQSLTSLMNGNNAQPRVPTLKDLYGPTQSLPWERAEFCAVEA